MKQIINIAKNNVFVTLAAAVAIIFITGQLGFGSFLSNRLAFGYGAGLGYLIRPLIGVNQPLLIPDYGREGRLFRNFGNTNVELEVPPHSVQSQTLFDVKQYNVSSADNVCVGSGEIIGDKAFTIVATNQNDNNVNSFGNDLTMSITMAGLPLDSSNLGIYYFNGNHQWVFGGQAVFNIENSKVTFQTKDAGTFAIIEAAGLPRLIESQARCQGQVLGIKEYEEGAILRTCDAQMYEIKNSQAVSIGRLELTNQSYQGKPVNDVDYEVIVRYTKPGSGPERYKDFNDGDLLRTCDWKIYRVEGNVFRHIGSHTELQSKYEGQVIHNVDYWQIAKYRNIDYSPEQLSSSQEQQVLGAKTYAEGTILRTSDLKVYAMKDGQLVYLRDLPMSQTKYLNNPIFNITDQEFQEITGDTNQQSIFGSDARVLGVKKYGVGALLRTRDWRVYQVEVNDRIRYITNLVTPNENTYQGREVIDVDYGVLAHYVLVSDDEPFTATTGKVLGAKTYADGTLVRIAEDGRIFVVNNGKFKHIATLDELTENYPGVKVINITLADFNLAQGREYTTGGRVLGVKKYGNNVLLKTPDWKVYQITDGKIHHIATIPGAQDYYQGKEIINVGYEELAQYERI
ncbi:MAG: hypothetical protein RB292_03030 [Patescibacteria group bacterium]|jgi:hypothetical protein|nr:hypothetical protein [Patescibacteria group bacterium]